MRTILAMAACALLTAGAAAAQTTTKTTSTTTGPTTANTMTTQGVAFGPNGLIIGGEGEIAIPIGNFSNGAGFGIGGYLTGEYKIQPNLSATGRVGLQLHLPKTETANGAEASTSIQLLPILAGVKFYLQGTDRQGLFLAGEAGFNLAYQHASVSIPGFGSSSNNEFDLFLQLGAGAGYQMGAVSFKAMLESVNIAHFGDALQLTFGAGLQFKGI